MSSSVRNDVPQRCTSCGCGTWSCSAIRTRNASLVSSQERASIFYALRPTSWRLNCMSARSEGDDNQFTYTYRGARFSQRCAEESRIYRRMEISSFYLADRVRNNIFWRIFTRPSAARSYGARLLASAADIHAVARIFLWSAIHKSSTCRVWGSVRLCASRDRNLGYVIAPIYPRDPLSTIAISVSVALLLRSINRSAPINGSTVNQISHMPSITVLVHNNVNKYVMQECKL